MSELARSCKTLRGERSGANIADYGELQIAAEAVEISDWGRFEGVVRLTVTNAIREGSGGGMLDPGQSLLAVGMPILRRKAIHDHEMRLGRSKMRTRKEMMP